MTKKGLNKVAGALLPNRQFTSRFRRDPNHLLAAYSLAPSEAADVKSSGQNELLSVGLDRRFVDPKSASRSSRSRKVAAD